MTRYRFLDGMGDVVAERYLPDHSSALAWARDGGAALDSGELDGGESAEEEPTDDVQRVEFLGPDGDWRWAGALEG